MTITLIRGFVAALCLLLTAAGLWFYPLPAWPLATALTLYGVVLLRWPALWLVVVPVALAAVDLSPWTGWFMVTESDLFVLVSLAVLAWRAPVDFHIGRLATWTIGLAVVATVIAALRGLTLDVGTGVSANPYLRPDNALREAKGFFEALAFVPFLIARQRREGDVVVWFAGGMCCALALVALVALFERAVFPGLFNTTTDYRVVGPFFSMHLGGGHIGAFFGLGLPFLIVGMRSRRPAVLAVTIAVGLLSIFALAVTFSRAAYAVSLLGTVTAVSFWMLRGADGRGRRFATLVLLGVIVAGVFVGATTTYMSQRFTTVLPDLATRENNWTSGLALRDPGLLSTVVGMGTGSYPRVAMARRQNGSVPTNITLGDEEGRRFVSLSGGSALYFGQKVSIERGAIYRLSLDLRSPRGTGALDVLLCEKLLLYSTSCDGGNLHSTEPNRWEHLTLPISTADMRGLTGLQTLRPIELSISNPNRGQSIEFGRLKLFDPAGRDLLKNGDFNNRLDRWYFTDDDHVAWRMEDQFLMQYFEGGLLGLAALLVLAGAALYSAAAHVKVEPMAAALIGSIIAFLASGIFDSLLQAPRLGMIFYLICFTALVLRPASPQP